MVQPIWIGVGLAWEPAEQAAAEQLLDAPPFRGRVEPLVRLSVDMRDIYEATHWAVRGAPPSYHTPDEDVYLPGRNIILLGKAGVFCAAAGLHRLVIGSLGHNPFPDATPAFRSSISQTLSLGLAHPLVVDAPYSDMSKADVIRRGATLGVPFELTLSCMGVERRFASVPRDRLPTPMHCGLCSKCRERHDAFVEAALPDPTTYVDARHTGA